MSSSGKTTTKISGGVHCADFIGRDQTNHYGFSAQEVSALIEKVLAFLDAGAAFIPERTIAGWGTRLEAEVNGEKLIFHPGAIQQLSQRRDLRSHLLALTVHRDYQVWATKFIPLAGKMDVRKVVDGLTMPVAFSEFRRPDPGAGPQAAPTTIPLADITDALDKHAAFVILGEPGAGKTTTLQKIAFEAAHTGLRGQTVRVPLFVRLSQQGEQTPLAFLKTHWEQHTGTDFADALAAGRVLALVDGVNEITRSSRDARLKAWRLFVQDCAGSNQFIFTGRTRDYDRQLDLPRVLVEPLDEPRIADYLQRNEAEGLMEILQEPHSRLHEMASNPFNLALLAFAYKSNQREMANRGFLLEWFAGELFGREERLAHPGWLPRDVQRRALAQLAYAMQEQGESTAFPLEQAKTCLPAALPFMGEDVAVPPAALFRFGRAATLLDPGTRPDVRFYHHLLQEYFAAVELLRRFQAGEDLVHLWRCKRLADEMPPSEAGEWDPLPEPPPTGWEVTTILACGLAPDPAALVEAVRPHNPALAGRCLAEAGIKPPEEALKSVRSDLLADLTNPAIHLRARLQAGYTLGNIGDPRFQSQTINGVNVILPTMVNVPAGTYSIGSPEQGLKVYAFDGTTYTGYNQTTAADGEATFTLPQGDYRFRSDKNGTQFWSYAENHCTVPGCTTATVTTTLPLTVTVQDTAGQPENGLKVYAFDGTSYTGYNKTTDVDGEVAFTLPQGDYRFRSDKNGTQFWSYAENHCTVPGCLSTVVTTTIPLTVSVKNEGNTPQTGLKVYAFDGTSYTGYNETTGVTGQAIFTLPQGEYRFRADREGEQYWSGESNHCTVPGCLSAAVSLPGGVVAETTVITYTYDSLYRLTSADYVNPDTGENGHSFAYVYDSVGNRLTKEECLVGFDCLTTSYTYDIANRLATVDDGTGPVTYVWDANGNLLNDGEKTYTYNHANRLTVVSGESSVVSFGYNGLGDRMQQTVDGETTTYTLDLAGGLTQVLSDGESSYLYGAGRIGEVASANWAYHQHDALGSLRQLTDNDGAVTLSRSYMPYGEELSSSGAGGSSYAFAGEWRDDPTGLVFLRARYYAPWDGRFLTQDPWAGNAQHPMSYNGGLYGYANPINKIDPSGLNPDCQHPWPSYCAYLRAVEIVDDEYPNGLNALIRLFEDDELYSTWGDVTGHSNQQRLSWILDVTRGSGGGGGPLYDPGIPFDVLDALLSCGSLVPFQFGLDFGGDEGFAQEFRDQDFYRTVWGSPDHYSTQVQHFLTAVALTETNPWDWGLKLIIGHEKLDDRTSTEWEQFNATTKTDIRLWQLAVDADNSGDQTIRDALLWKILEFKPDITFGYVAGNRVGNSLQDLRLSLKSYQFFTWIQQNKSSTPVSAADWIRLNLHKDYR